MPEITVECSNPQEVRLRVTAEMTIGEWAEVLKLTKNVSYYGPLQDLLIAVRQGIAAIEERENVKWIDKPYRPHLGTRPLTPGEFLTKPPASDPVKCDDPNCWCYGRLT
jgi:hypothetical protein